MARAPLDDELWKLIQPLLPLRKRRLYDGPQVGGEEHPTH